MKTLIKILISLGCGVAFFALCAVLFVWSDLAVGDLTDLFTFALLAFFGLVIFVVVLILQLNKVKQHMISSWRKDLRRRK